MKFRNQNDNTYPIMFLLTLSSDHITGATGKTPTLTISKNGAVFGAHAGAVTELANGWYKWTPAAADFDTKGELLLHASAADCDPYDEKYEVGGIDFFAAVAGIPSAVWAYATANANVVGSMGKWLLDNVGAVRAVTDNISGVTFVHSPVDEDGNTRIVKGKRYTGSQKLHYTSDTTRDLSAATIVALEFDGESFPADSITGSVGDWDIYIPITNAQSLTLSPGVYAGELAVFDTSPTPDEEIPELAQFTVTVDKNR